MVVIGGAKALLGLVLVLGMAVAGILLSVVYVPEVQKTVLEEGIAIAREKTGYDIDLGRIYLSPFHQSPKILYRAYKGTGDLPVQVEIDSLYVGHRGEDTVVYVRSLRLRATARTREVRVKSEEVRDKSEELRDKSQELGVRSQEFTNIPIGVEELRVEELTFHSDSMIAAVGIDAVVGHLAATSPEIVIAQGKYPLHGLRLSDADIAIDLRETPPDTAAQDTVPLRMVFDVPDGELRNIRFRLTPLGMDIRSDYIGANVLADVGANLYDARRIDIGGLRFGLGALRIPADTIYGDARVDLEKNMIRSRGLHVRSSQIGAQADLYATEMDLERMRVDVTGDAEYQGSKASLRARYDIDDEAYDAEVHVERVNLSAFMVDAPRIVVAGDIEAQGKGVNPKRALRSHVKVRLDEAIYGSYDFSHSEIEVETDSTSSLALDMPGLEADVYSPLPLFQLLDQIGPLVDALSDSAVVNGITSLRDMTLLDTLRAKIPPLRADISLHKGSPLQGIIDDTGVDLEQVALALRSDARRTDLAVDGSIWGLSTIRYPNAVEAGVKVSMSEGTTDASVKAHTELTDGVMEVEGLCTDADFQLDLKREEGSLYGNGQLRLDSISFGNKALGNHTIELQIAPSTLYPNALRAGIHTEDIPVELVNSFVTLPDIALEGAIRASASVDGLPAKTDISAEVRPLGVKAVYTPYAAGLSLGETPIVMQHNHVDLNGLPVYGADSTYLTLHGGLDLNSMRMDVRLEGDSFAPVKLPRGGPIPVYGDLATDIRGSVTGSLDSIVADVDVTLLPSTDITYPIDKKNLAQVKPHGTVNVRYQSSAVSDQALTLGGWINVDDGFVRYSPKAYPIMPFHVDSGSHVAFNGPIGQTELHVSASQQVKADVESNDEETRRVDFRTGVRVNGALDSIGLKSIGFFLEAPEDETITRELTSLDEETREGLAATLLATGMYVGESNVAAQRDGYALSSIINSRINAAMANSKLGKVVDIDISSGQSTHASGKTNDMNISISKSFLHDKLRITLGSTITDNPEVNETNGILSNLSVDYKLTKEGHVLLRLFSQRDYNNVLEGELYKAGLGVRATKDWHRKELYRGDSITRVYGLTADAGVAYRSNNSIGPDLTLKSTIRNLLGNGETFTLKGNGAYYWALRDRHPGDPKKTDTYKLGLNASLIFPYLHWTGENNPEGDTRYMLGYQYENIAGGYGVHKLSGSFTYFIHSPNSPYITHAFTPFGLSVVMMKAEAEDLWDKAAEYPQLIKVLAGDEFVPSIAYNFIYDDYRAKRAVNTFLNLGVKEAGNLINAIYCAFGHKWDEMNKPLGKITFNQFVKLSAELHNRFNLTEQVSIATRLYAGANIPLGNSMFAPLSEAFYAGGPNSLRAAAPYAYGPGNFYSAKYNQNFFHAGDVKLEANFELRFPIVWKLYGAAFLDAGNVWNWYSTVDLFKAAGFEDYLDRLEIPETLYDGIINNPEFGKQIALGTGAGLRIDLEGLVVRLDIGVGIHAPYQTFKYDKEGKPDLNQPINTYFNIPSALDAIRINFGIGYPF